MSHYNALLDAVNQRATGPSSYVGWTVRWFFANIKIFSLPTFVMEALMPTKNLAAGAGVTAELADAAATLKASDLTPDALTMARHCLLDWFAVTIAGAAEPLVEILSDEVAVEGGNAQALIVGQGRKGTVQQAALVNGAASHALDYDDVHSAMIGHPTVPVATSLLALASERPTSGMDLLTAFVAGYEIECRIGRLIQGGHYGRGFHSTATIGTVGAAVGAGHLLGLDSAQMATAIGIAATQAAGLKSQFGTMCKPLHVGKAASSGLLAARLAARGFTGRSDMLEAAQGLADAMSDDFDPDAARAAPPRDFYIRENLFKYHAACYLTHSTIELSRDIAADASLTADDIKAVQLSVDPGHLKVCHILEPEDGLQTKFSLRHTAAFAIAGDDTAQIDTYSDANAVRPDLVALRRKVTVVENGGPFTMASAVIETTTGQRFEKQFDVGVPAVDLADQERRLRAKFDSLVQPHLGAEESQGLRDELMRFEGLNKANAVFSRLSGWVAKTA